ncbi:MAG: peptidoglycan editing factor PgeF [Clostridia bacterium]|nr:peptidoglycan editing factor PgeF [Clostridia bacterium]
MMFDRSSKNLARGYTLHERNGIGILKSDAFSRIPVIEHGFSTRIGGVSPAPYDSMNLSLTRDDSKQNVLRNYRIFFEVAGLDINRAVLVNHEHGANVERVDRGNFGQGLTREQLPFCDGIVTNDPEVTLVTLHADCGCVYLYDPKNHAIGLAHAGWKGTFKRVAQRLAERMREEFTSEPETMIASLGPSICKNCFEVDESIADDFVSEFSCESLKKTGRNGKAFVDIEEALIIQLTDAGVKQDNISSMGICTFERSDILYSYRRDRGRTGAMIGYLKLRAEA